MMSRRSSALAFASASASALVVAAWAVPAAAHIQMTNPPARYGMNDLKDGPCGMIGNPPGVDPPTLLQAGETITITLDEFTDHPGHFRIAFSADGTDQFVNPTAFDDFYNDPSVLMDNIPDEQVGGIHEIDFTVPEVNCDPCTLQVLQVMTGGSFSEGSLYYQCADIVIEGAAAGTTDSGGSGEDATATDATATATAGDDTSSEGGDDGTTAGDDAADDAADDAPQTDATADGTDSSITATGTTDSDQDDESSGGCGCTAGTRPSALWMLPLLFVGYLRRR